MHSFKIKQSKHKVYFVYSTRFLTKIQAQELIATMQLMTSKQVLIVFCQISFLITRSLLRNSTYPFEWFEAEDTGKTTPRVFMTKNFYKILKPNGKIGNKHETVLALLISGSKLKTK